jgi:cytochrome c
LSNRSSHPGSPSGLPSALVVLAFALVASPVARADDASTEALMKKSNCFKCHAVASKKDGPSFRETAAKYKGKPDAEAALYKHLTTNPTVKVDGKEEPHDNLKTKNEAEVREVIKWILSR